MSDDAAATLAAAVTERLRGIGRLAHVADGAPIAGGQPQAVVEIGAERDWGHKSGAGAELVFAVVVEVAGERPDGARALLTQVRAAVDGIGPDLPGWRVVTCVMLRARVARGGAGKWVGSVEWRARMLRG